VPPLPTIRVGPVSRSAAPASAVAGPIGFRASARTNAALASASTLPGRWEPATVPDSTFSAANAVDAAVAPAVRLGTIAGRLELSAAPGASCCVADGRRAAAEASNDGLRAAKVSLSKFGARPTPA
jgi:hypothetical protein